MAVNVAIAVVRSTHTALASAASTGHQGVMVWTTDTNEIFVDSGTGTGIGPGNAWLRLANDIQVFVVANQAARLALTNVDIGDLALQQDTNLTYILTAVPASTAANWTAIAVTSGTTIQGLGVATPHEFVTFIDNSGVQHLAQPAFTDISGSLAQTQLPATIGAGSSLTVIDCGTIP